MENGIVVFYDNQVLTVLVVHKTEFLSLNQILDHYAEEFGFERKHISGTWSHIIDITDIQSGQAQHIGYAKNDWPKKEKTPEHLPAPDPKYEPGE